jgi:putative oxidoreductase
VQDGAAGTEPRTAERALSGTLRLAIGWILRLGLGALFVLAGVLKLAQPAAFAIEIVNYRLLPGLAPYLAATLPAIEVVLGVALVAAPVAWQRAAALSMAGLLALFTVAVGQVVARGINVDCGCFGGNSGPVTGWTIARDLALLAAAVAAVALSAPRPQPPEFHA